jgi:DNA-binding MurR/RpiR family transcriptional regulator
MILKVLKEVAVDTNQEWAEKLGVNPSTAITTVSY